MDLQRLFLFLVFTFSLLIVWDNWQRYKHPDVAPQQVNIEAADATRGMKEQVSPSSATSIAPLSGLNKQVNESSKIHVKTDLFDIEICTNGGDICKLSLLKHPDALDKSKPLVLFQGGENSHNYISQSGLIGSGLPNHNSEYTSVYDHYDLAEGAEKLEIRLSPKTLSSLSVAKVITFRRNSYLINVSYELENNGTKSVTASDYYQLIRDAAAPEGSIRFLPTFTGVAVYTDKDKFQKIQFSDIEKNKVKYPTHANDGWIGILQHYFVSAWIPEENTNREYFTRKLDGGLYSAGVVLPEHVIIPGQKIVTGVNLYAGPTEANLNSVAPGLGLTVDYGWLTIIATPLFWTMSLFYKWTQNWGLAIILLTVLIKLIFFPLSAASYRSMAKMRVVAPKLEKIKKQYADDREQLNRAMMDLYKTEKINPLGGCLPVLIQIPVFIALYWAILSSVELRYAPFFGWITNLSAADPYYILPIIMGASMIIQMRLNPKPPDPLQAKIMQTMPIVFSVMFFFFPAGLVLYSIVNNILSIIQQWYITRHSGISSKGVTSGQ